MNYYAHDLIPSFFSSGEGEGAKIKNLYHTLQENYYNKVVTESVICDVDLNIAGSAYLEYLNGMCAFIGETCDSCIDGEKYAKESATIDEMMENLLNLSLGVSITRLPPRLFWKQPETLNT